MNTITTFEPGALVRQPARLIALSRMLDAITDVEMERTIEMLIAIRDARDGDTDREPNGDELDGTGGEDDFGPQKHARREPGCPVSDPGGCEHDGRENGPAEDGLVPTYGLNQAGRLTTEARAGVSYVTAPTRLGKGQ